MVFVDEQEARLRLEASISGLAERAPAFSARRVVTRTQRQTFLAAAGLILVGLLVSPTNATIGLIGVVTFFYLAATCFRVYLFGRSTDPDLVEHVSDEEARSLPSADLPVYTVLIPAYREPEVIGDLLKHMRAVEYPRDRLDIKLLIEADDSATIAAIRGADPGDEFELVLVPPSEPRTKPKALNYGLSLARGEIVTIFDAEDQPEPLQMRRAVVALGRHGPDLAGVQAKLSYANPDQNIITKWFTIEYGMWFSLLLPGLAAGNAPIPLGGTSNHFRREALERIGAWDPYNVTEDADLGIRLFREHYSVRILESTTLEEANSDFINWVRQRSRWYKGYLQTLLIHLRSPLALYRDVGLLGMTQLVLFVGGTPLLAVLNPVFWAMTGVWFVAHPAVIQALFPAPLFYAGLLCWSVGNFLIAYLTVVSCRLTRRPELFWAALLVPVYWVMMAIAGVKAVWQLLVAPAFWEKTVHGLHRRPEQPAVAEPSPAV